MEDTSERKDQPGWNKAHREPGECEQQEEVEKSLIR